MKKIPILLLAATMTIAGTAVADELEDMMKKNGCNACHAESKKVIGPSYVDVANKYKGDASAPAKLADKIKKGGVLAAMSLGLAAVSATAYAEYPERPIQLIEGYPPGR